MNLEKLRKHKDEATRQLAKGRIKEALDELLAVQKMDPQDLANRQKLGDLYRKLGSNVESIKCYQAVSGAYAADGLLLKAIAVCKIILQIDPNHTETQRALADLYGKKRGDAGSVELPVAMSAAVLKAAPGQKLSANMIRGLPSAHLAGAPSTPHAAPAPPKTPPGPAPSVPAASVFLKPPLMAGLTPPPPPSKAPPPFAPPPPPVEDTAEFEGEAVDVVSADIEEELPPAVMGQPVGEENAPARASTGVSITVVSGPAASWTGSPQEDDGLEVPMVAAAGPADLEEMEMPPPPPPSAGGEKAGADEFADFLAEEPSAPHKVDLDKLPPIPLFSDLSKNAFIDLMERMDIRSMSAGDVIITEGEKGDSFFIIASGTVKIEKAKEDGGVIPLATLTDGAFFGEIALLSDAPRTASVVAATDGELFEISQSTLSAVVRDFPSVSQVLQKFYKQRLLSNLLNTSPIFSQFDKDQRKSLIEMFRSREVPRGEDIIIEGQKGDGLYVVLSGRAKVTRGSKQLATLKEGDLFGEMSLLTREPVNATVTATGKAMVLRLPRKQFNEVIMTHPQVLEMVSELSARRQRSNV